jgi:RimJ/RimL family protein N-acetyltransferase
MSSAAPVLETQRLTLRPHRVTDFDDLLAMWSDPKVTRHIGGKPSTREEVWSRLLRYIGHWTALGFGYWALEERSSHRFVGEAGFADFKRDIQPTLDGMPEAGWVLAAWSHGGGHATEAAERIVRWGDDHFGQRKTSCVVAVENLQSLRVAAKTGYREVARTTYHGGPVIVFTREPRSVAP